VTLDPATPDIDAVLKEVEEYIDAESSISAVGMTITMVPNTFVVINHPNGKLAVHVKHFCRHQPSNW
jgi:hypothetical protein